ncbi:hypothetical protein FHX74_000465 [Friedmanniella endophytica]|uniref:NlpC/P60 family protein n=1 Tax=Microlunatus kandeliicorticis TaxID=1759536 RepID=A0A7W3P4G3_9ACTN|nr:hypothetical protein [Microlunatus kandeliicorticis]MBA8792871.1 hypothetical protein [Microlunatus kandeliicorticis]
MSAQQIRNARTIDQVVRSLGFSGQAALVTLVAAVGESDLVNVDYGDTAGPDSRGLFQQRSSWGTEAQRMDPVYATQSFLLGPQHDGKAHGPGGTGLVAIPGWQSMTPAAAIHAVQINADPNHYTKFIPEARQIAARAGIDLTHAGSDLTSAGLAAVSSGGCTGITADAAAVGTGACPLDGVFAPGHKNPNTCNQALAFEQAQIDSGTHQWHRACLALVARAYGWHGSGEATARQAAQTIIDAGQMHTDTTDIPRGAILWWDGSAVGNSAGHVAIYAGGGLIYSSDAPANDGSVGRVPWDYPMSRWHQRLLGWSPPYFLHSA